MLRLTSAGINLLLQIIHFLNIIVVLAYIGHALVSAAPSPLGLGHGSDLLGAQFRNAVGMTLGVPRHRDAEIVAEVLANVPDQVEGAREPPLGGGPLPRALRGIPPEGDDVAYAPVVRRPEGVVNGPDGIAVLLHVRARQVHVRDVTRPVRVERDLEGQFGGRSPGAPRHVREEASGVRLHAVHAGVEVLHALLGAGREVLQ